MADRLFKKLLLLFSVLVMAGNVAFAQDDDLPPPSSKPEQTTEPRNDQRPPANNNFKGFGKSKFDISKFIIEPIVNLSISQYRLDIGFAPSVGYRVWQSKTLGERWGNTGLFLGAGVSYFYTGVTTYRPVGNGTTRVNLQTYGGGPLIQYNIWRGLFVRTKLELLARRMPVGADLIKNEYIYRTKFTPAWLVGAGYNLLQSKNIFIPVIVSYDLLHSVVSKDYSIYPRGFTVQLGFITLF